MEQKDLTEFSQDDEREESDTAAGPNSNATTDGTGSTTDPFRPETCIGFDVAADFAHFRRVGNNSARPTYRIPPRTTVVGMLAAIMGLPRDSYYDLFEPTSSAVAVVPKEMPHIYMMGITTVNTNENTIYTVPFENSSSNSVKMLTAESYLETWTKPGKSGTIETPRQRDTYEMLVDPVYRVYVALDDADMHQDLQERLATSRYHYSPSLGLSECLAEIDAVDTHTVTSATTDTIDSVAYEDIEVVPEPDTTIRRERAPLYMEATENGRRTTAFGNITYAADGGPLSVRSDAIWTVGDHDVLFH